jgi:hypothetical protein
MDGEFITFIDDKCCYDPLLLKYIINYIVMPYYYVNDTNSNGDCLFYINKNIMMQIFNDMLKKHNITLNYYEDFMKHLLNIYELSLVNNDIYNNYNEIIELLPTLPNNILYEYIYRIFRINPIIWKLMINPITLIKYIKHNSIFAKKCDDIRIDNIDNNMSYAPTERNNVTPSIYALFIICNHIYLSKKTYNNDILIKYSIEINDIDYELIDFSNTKHITFIDLIKHDVDKYENIIKIISLNWSYNIFYDFDYQKINKTLFIFNTMNNLHCLFKLWWLCSSTYNETEHKLHNRKITYTSEIHQHRACDKLYDLKEDICPYNIYKKNGCNLHCMINEMRFILTDQSCIRQFYNPINKSWFNITNMLCKSCICNSEKYIIKGDILLDKNVVNEEDYKFITDSEEIINYIHNKKKEINPCNMIGCCCKEKSFSLTYVTLPKNDAEFKKLIDLYKCAPGDDTVTKYVINKYIIHDEYCYTCASLIITYQLKNAKRISNISTKDMHYYLIKSSYQIANLGTIKTFQILYNNRKKIKKNVKIEFKLIDKEIDGTLIFNDVCKYIKRTSTKCKCVNCSLKTT